MSCLVDNYIYMCVHLHTSDYVKLNKTERKAYAWLLSKGYAEDEIIFQGRSTPDFLTSDGKGWEAKLVYGIHTVWISPSQFDLLKQMTNTTIVVYKSDSVEPLLLIPSDEIEVNKIFDGIRIVLPKEMMQTVSIDDETMRRLKIHVASENQGTTYGFIGSTASEAINKFIDHKELQSTQAAGNQPPAVPPNNTI